MVTKTPLLRNSERSAFRRCPQAWWWGWREGLRPRGTAPNALWFGTGWHLVMAHWYCGPGLKRGADPLGVWDAYVADQVRYVRDLGDSPDGWMEMGELGTGMIVNYLNEYGTDEDWNVIAPERAFQIDIFPKGKKSGKPIVIYCGTFDGAYKSYSTGRLWLMEHKTAAQVTTSHLPLDDQAGGYHAVATDIYRHDGNLGPNERLHGITYNFARKALTMDEDRPRDPKTGLYTNKPLKVHFQDALGEKIELTGKESLKVLQGIAEENGITVYGDPSANQKRPAPLFVREEVTRRRAEAENQIDRIRREVAAMNWFREDPSRVYKTTTRDCNFCPHYNMCVLDEEGSPDVDEYKRLVYNVEDPYADHRQAIKESGGG